MSSAVGTVNRLEVKITGGDVGAVDVAAELHANEGTGHALAFSRLA